MLLVLVVLVSALGPEFVLVSAPLELSLSLLVIVSALLGLDLVSTLDPHAPPFLNPLAPPAPPFDPPVTALPCLDPPAPPF
ncbi:hypothetical protein Tco_1415849 [Tanacetum coccineum]